MAGKLRGLLRQKEAQEQHVRHVITDMQQQNTALESEAYRVSRENEELQQAATETSYQLQEAIAGKEKAREELLAGQKVLEDAQTNHAHAQSCQKHNLQAHTSNTEQRCRAAQK